MSIDRQAKAHGAYHHGDLPRAVLDAALGQMTDGDRFAVNINAIAKALGVSHGAVYRHFPTKQSIIDALAKSGFERLYEAFVAAIAPGVAAESTSPTWKIRALAHAYVDFALAEPTLIRVMFSGAAAERQRDPELKRAAYRTIMVLQDEVFACARLGLLAEDDGYDVTRFFWSGIHGIALLRVESQLDGMLASDDEVRRLVDASVSWMLTGVMGADAAR